MQSAGGFAVRMGLRYVKGLGEGGVGENRRGAAGQTVRVAGRFRPAHWTG